MRVSDYIIKFLKENYNVDTIFTVSGGGCIFLVDSLTNVEGVSYIATHHEQAAALAAEGYARMGNRLGACVVTSGPGGTNALTGTLSNWVDSIPVIYISGQVNRDMTTNHTRLPLRQLGDQEFNIIKVVESMTKYAVQVNQAEEIRYHIEKACKLATTGRPGPVWLDIPLDLQEKLIIKKTNKYHLRESPASYSTPSNHDISAVLQSWKKAKRPILLVGNGVRLARIEKELQDLLRITNTPCLLTWKMIDFLDENDPLNAGRPGSVAQPWANYSQQSSDFLLSIGARLDTGQTAYNLSDFAPNAEIFVVDIDINELNKLPSRFQKINLGAREFVTAASSLLVDNAYNMTFDESWINQIGRWKSKYAFPRYEMKSAGNTVDLYAFFDFLSRILDSSAVLIPGSSGACSEVLMQAFKTKKGQRIFNSEGLGPMGFGIPAAIGGCFASNKEKIVTVDGDGGFLMNVQDLGTVKLHNLPIKFFILNNNGYGSIKRTQDNLFEGRRIGTEPETGIYLPDWKKVSNLFEIEYTKIENLEESHGRVLETIESSNPAIIEVIVDQNQTTQPRTITERHTDGSIVTRPMHELTNISLDNEFLSILSKPRSLN